MNLKKGMFKKKKSQIESGELQLNKELPIKFKQNLNLGII